MLDFLSIYENGIKKRFELERSLANSDSDEKLINFEILVGLDLLRTRHWGENSNPIPNDGNTKERQNYCQICDENVETVKNTVFHIIENHHKTCPYCDMTLFDPRTLRRHIDRKHKMVYNEYLTIRQKIKETIKDDASRTNYKYACKICRKKFENPAGVRQHKLGHKTETFSCQICAQNFKWKRSLDRHLVVHQSKKYECRFCNYQNIRNYRVRNHELQKHPNDSNVIIFEF